MMGYGWGFSGVGVFVMVLVWVALIALVVWAVTSLSTSAGHTGASSRTGGRGALAAVVVLALLGLLVAAVWAFSTPRGPGEGWPYGGPVNRYDGGMMDGGMMGDGFAGGGLDGYRGVTGSGPVATLAQAGSAAQRYADRLGLDVGEVMQFDNGFYAELHDADGVGATEVLVDAEDGDVRVEYGPAMMWNTAYGMHAAGSTLPVQVSADEARDLAEEWLDERGADSDEGVGEAEEFPGYYTLHTEQGGEVSGMLSVNAYTGAVWYHSWHGAFLDMTGH